MTTHRPSAGRGLRNVGDRTKLARCRGRGPPAGVCQGRDSLDVFVAFAALLFVRERGKVFVRHIPGGGRVAVGSAGNRR